METAVRKKVKRRKGRAGRDKERAELAEVPKSKVLVLQTATDEWNLEGTTKTRTGGELTRERAARELETRALDVRRTGLETVRPGEVRPSENPKLVAIERGKRRTRLDEEDNG
jgi:hypothetical protein